MVSRQDIDEVIKSFYAFTYGVTVLDPYEISDVVMRLDAAAKQARSLIEQATLLISDVLNGSKIWTDDYLKLSSALNMILLQASVMGVSPDDARPQKMLLDILRRKQTFTHENGAWSQYEDLASWLVEVGSLINVSNSLLKTEFLDLVQYSFRHMSKELYKGSSWAAFQVWHGRFQEMIMENQHLISEACPPESFNAYCCVGEVVG